MKRFTRQLRFALERCSGSCRYQLQACHLKAIGTGFDCAIGANAPYGVVSGTFEDNVANGLGRVNIEVIQKKAVAD
jgi:hypothetical protein